MYEDAMATQSGDSTQQQQLSALHQLLRKCEHQVLQLLYPLMEVCVVELTLVQSPVACPLDKLVSLCRSLASMNGF